MNRRGGVDVRQPLPSRFRRFYDSMYRTTILKILLVGLYTAVDRGFLYKILDPDPSTHTSFESSRKGGSNGQIKIF